MVEETSEIQDLKMNKYFTKKSLCTPVSPLKSIIKLSQILPKRSANLSNRRANSSKENAKSSAGVGTSVGLRVGVGEGI